RLRRAAHRRLMACKSRMSFLDFLGLAFDGVGLVLDPRAQVSVGIAESAIHVPVDRLHGLPVLPQAFGLCWSKTGLNCRPVTRRGLGVTPDAVLLLRRGFQKVERLLRRSALVVVCNTHRLAPFWCGFAPSWFGHDPFLPLRSCPSNEAVWPNGWISNGRKGMTNEPVSEGERSEAGSTGVASRVFTPKGRKGRGASGAPPQGDHASPFEGHCARCFDTPPSDAPRLQRW